METLQNRIKRSCTYTVVTCVDWRLHGELGLDPFIQSRADGGNPIRYDLVTTPGCCDCFVHEDSLSIAQREQVMNAIQHSIDLHHPETVILIQHTDCDRYASRGRLPEDRRSQELVLKSDLVKAAFMIKEAFPKVQLVGFTARLHEEHVAELESASLSTELRRVRSDRPRPSSLPPEPAFPRRHVTHS